MNSYTDVHINVYLTIKENFELITKLKIQNLLI